MWKGNKNDQSILDLYGETTYCNSEAPLQLDLNKFNKNHISCRDTKIEVIHKLGNTLLNCWVPIILVITPLLL